MGTRRQGGAAFVLSTAITLIFAGLLLGQSIGTGQLPQTEPSPLSEFSPTSELIEQLNHSGKPFTRGNIVTCLLYTSPSPRDLSTSRMPSSA